MTSNPRYPGSVMKITWAGETSHVGNIEGIVANDVTDPGDWYATYTWDGENGVLELDRPVQFPPQNPPLADEPDEPARIRRIAIDRWGTADLAKPLEWSGPARGFVTITFIPNSSKPSGPIGNVTGP